MKKHWWLYGLAIILLVFSFLWLAMTIWVEQEGSKKMLHLSSLDPQIKVLVLYDPDPIYNLDEQICVNIGKGLASKNVDVVIATVAEANELDMQLFNGFVLCANTYNWSPDWAMVDWVTREKLIEGKPVVAVTVGSGSTDTSQKRFKHWITLSGGKLIEEHTWWLMRPNDESRMKESNISVACSEAYDFGIALADKMNVHSAPTLH